MIACDLAEIQAPMRRTRLLALLLLLLAACGREAQRASFVLATTTSVHDSGLLFHLGWAFARDTGIEIDPLSVGSGKALELAAAGTADATITHDATAEARFVAERKPAVYRPFMYNEFVVVGPVANPAGVAPDEPVVESFRKIARARSRFCSRGDRSGTHAREIELWRAAEVDPAANPGYTTLGQSMGALLRSADEIGCYALADLPTFAQFSSTIDLVVVNRGDERLRNVYAVTLASDDEEARAFVDWLLSERGRHAIESFTIGGKRLFFPVDARFLQEKRPAARA